MGVSSFKRRLFLDFALQGGTLFILDLFFWHPSLRKSSPLRQSNMTELFFFDRFGACGEGFNIIKPTHILVFCSQRFLFEILSSS
jgi:hypothetical protein